MVEFLYINQTNPITMHKIIIALLVLSPFLSLGQQYSFSGKVIDPEGTTLPSATVALLNPIDSTLSNFCITDNNGFFELKNLKKGEFLLQVAFIGYQTYYKKVEIPLKDSDPWLIGLKPQSIELDEAKITAEKGEEEDDPPADEADCMAVETSSAVPDEMKSLTSTQRIARLSFVLPPSCS